MTMRRFRVAEDSMRPGLPPGTEVVAVDDREPSVGDLVVFPHPGRADFWMVKRRVRPPEPIPEGHMWVMSDSPGVTRADSRGLGPIPLDGAMTVVDRLDQASFTQACLMLASEDDSLGRLVAEHGLPEMWSRPPGFRSLALLIVEQQVSLESAAAVFTRMLEVAGALTPHRVVEIGPGPLMRSGLTRQKTGYVIGLAEAVIAGSLDLEGLDRLSLDEARQALLDVRGIGPWTADAYLLSVLGHIDAFPVGDRALQVGVGEALGMQSPPDPSQLEIVAEPWRPVRAVAARLVWHAYLRARGRAEPTIGSPVV